MAPVSAPAAVAATLVLAALLVAAGPRRLAAMAQGLERLHDRSASGRRLARRLSDAVIDLGPARWRAAQAFLVLPAAIIATTAAGSAATGLAIGGAAVRAGGAVVLRARRGRRDRLLVDAALLIGQHLATELGAGASPADAMSGLHRSARLQRRPLAAALVASVMGRLSGGVPLATALAEAASAPSTAAGDVAVRRLAVAVELAVDRGAGTVPLTRFCTGVEARLATDAQVRAIVAEVRTAAIAVPILSAAVGLLLTGSDPGAGAAALSFPVLPIMLVCTLAAASGTALVRRLTRA